MINFIAFVICFVAALIFLFTGAPASKFWFEMALALINLPFAISWVKKTMN